MGHSQGHSVVACQESTAENCASKVKNIPSVCCQLRGAGVLHAGLHRDRVLESIAQARINLLDRPFAGQDPHVMSLLQADMKGSDCMILTQHLAAFAPAAHVPERKPLFRVPEEFSRMLKGKYTLGNDFKKRASFRQGRLDL